MYCNNNPLKYIDPSGLYYLEKDNNGQVYAVIQSGDTLSGIALSEVGNANAYTKITGVSDYNNIHIGQRVNITAIYNDKYRIDNINFTKKSTGSKHKMPDTGDPNSKDTIYNPDGTPKQERYYGPDGNPSYDDDYNHGGDGHGIGFPHRHPWINGKRQKQPIPIPSENISRNESVGVLVIGGIVTLIELAGYFYGVPIDLPGN